MARFAVERGNKLEAEANLGQRHDTDVEQFEGPPRDKGGVQASDVG